MDLCPDFLVTEELVSSVYRLRAGQFDDSRSHAFFPHAWHLRYPVDGSKIEGSHRVCGLGLELPLVSSA